MTDKQLARLGRPELLKLLIEQGQVNERLQQEIEELKARLADREIQVRNAGSLADVAAAVNGILGAAQSTADQYMENLNRLIAENTENTNRERAEAKAEIEQRREDARIRAERTASECAKLYSEAQNIVAEARREAERILEQARKAAQ